MEVKARERTLRVHQRQLFTYLRLMDLQVGLLVNFGETLMKDGLRRVVNGYTPTSESKLRINQSS